MIVVANDPFDTVGLERVPPMKKTQATFELLLSNNLRKTHSDNFLRLYREAMGKLTSISNIHFD